jgi:tRNA (uracil-5-)-methyltransferase TRM9
VESEIARRLVDLNRAFYQSFAASFAETRARVQPGAHRLLARIGSETQVADFGCGNGNAAGFLAEHGFRGAYLGLDVSDALVDIARARALPFPAQFLTADFLTPGWERSLTEHSFDFILLFAVLHHIPGGDHRAAFLQATRKLLLPGGHLFLSTWQFHRSEKLRARVVPWKDAGFNEADLDAGDYLLDWRREGRGLRYVHVVDGAERRALAVESGFTEREAFASDGEGGRLADYAVWMQGGSVTHPALPTAARS